MAEGIRYVCDHCQQSIEAWDEGHPYFIDKAGRKRYAYHPQPEREWCTGVESPNICLSCGNRFTSDSAAPTQRCPKCSSFEIAETFSLDGRQCPSCKAGVFKRDPTFHAIS